MRTITTRDGHRIPVLGQGTWMMGSDPARRREEVHALNLGMDLGMTLIDTAEMYASGGAEEVVGEAVRRRRDEVYLVTKVIPDNATYSRTKEACERSLRRLGVETIDLYLLHWTSSHPLEETLRAFRELREEGKIRSHGVSNFDTPAMAAARALPGGEEIASNQILYNLEARGPEHSLLPWGTDHDVFAMAYSPVGVGKLATSAALRTVAERHDVSPYVAAIAWTLRHPGVVSIPKAVKEPHLRENARAVDMTLTAEDEALLDADYPPPAAETPLATA